MWCADLPWIKFENPENCDFVRRISVELSALNVSIRPGRPQGVNDFDIEISVMPSSHYDGDMLMERQFRGTIDKWTPRAWWSSVKDVDRNCASMTERRLTEVPASLLILSRAGMDLVSFKQCILFSTLEYLGYPLELLKEEGDEVELSDTNKIVLCLMSGAEPRYTQSGKGGLAMDELEEKLPVAFDRCVGRGRTIGQTPN